MLIARVQVTATDEGRQTLVDALTAEANQIQSRFDGCELYVVSVDTSDPNTVMIAEEWATKAGFEAYVGSDHFSKTMAVVGPCLAAPPNSAYYEGERVGP
jgi:quinol monooxygenase YgiN